MNLTGRYQTKPCLSGSILLSHPSLKDPSFYKTIVFLSAHSDDMGTVGVILNRPLGQTLQQLDNNLKPVHLQMSQFLKVDPSKKIN